MLKKIIPMVLYTKTNDTPLGTVLYNIDMPRTPGIYKITSIAAVAKSNITANTIRIYVERNNIRAYLGYINLQYSGIIGTIYPNIRLDDKWSIIYYFPSNISLSYIELSITIDNEIYE
jgi:hypothetical protein